MTDLWNVATIYEDLATRYVLTLRRGYAAGVCDLTEPETDGLWDALHMVIGAADLKLYALLAVVNPGQPMRVEVIDSREDCPVRVDLATGVLSSDSVGTAANCGPTGLDTR